LIIYSAFEHTFNVYEKVLYKSGTLR